MKVHNFKNWSINEGVFNTNMDDMMQSVEKWTKQNISSNANVTKKDNSIQIDIEFSSGSFSNSSDDDIVRSLKERLSKLHNAYDKKYRDFFIKGLNLFGDTNYVSVYSSASLLKRKVTYASPNNYHEFKERVFSYTEMGYNDMGDYNTYIKRYGEVGLNKLNLSILLSINKVS